MTWEQRTRPAAYVSPSGRRIAFDYEDASKSFDRHTSAHTFPGINGTYVQDLGHSSRRYPTRAVFWGANHDLQAATFLAALREPGRGRLEHPRDGSVLVVPFGAITTREDLVERANETVIEVELWESIGSEYPGGFIGQDEATLSAVNAAYAEAAAAFAEELELALPADVALARNRVLRNVSLVRDTLGAVAGQDPGALRTFTRIADSIVEGVETISSDPSIIAGQVTALLRTPVGAGASVAAVALGYGGFVNALTPSVTGDQAFKVDELFAMTAVAAYIEAAVSADYRTRADALASAAEIGRQFDAVNTWREANYAAS